MIEITDEMREIARIVNKERSSRRLRKSWLYDKDSFAYQSRWGKQVFMRLYRTNKLQARAWAVERFGSERAKELIAAWLHYSNN